MASPDVSARGPGIHRPRSVLSQDHGSVLARSVVQPYVRPVLNRLEERGLVCHREPYWAIGEPEGVSDAMLFSSTTEFLDEGLGPESREEWWHTGQKDEASHE